MIDVNWEDSESYILINPTYSKSDQERFYTILQAAHAWPGHIWLSTSGSSVQKWVGLSKQALLASAQAVNQHLDSHREDRWVHALPFFHVGGLGIWARAYLSGAQVYDFKEQHPGKWQADKFYSYMEEVQGTLTALVPAQLHDLVMLERRAPSSLRAMVIGGGALLPQLYEKAIRLGWPILPSYGLTECASQVATASLNSWQQNQIPSLQLLSHLQACEKEGHLCFKGLSLLSTYAYLDQEKLQFCDPKVEEWLISEDRGMIQNRELHLFGRADAMLKVGGENVDVARLENHLQTLCLEMRIEAEVTLLAMPDVRLGYCIQLASNSNQEKITPLIEQFQKTVLPFERIRKIHFLPQLPRSSLGKILKKELQDLIQN